MSEDHANLMPATTEENSVESAGSLPEQTNAKSDLVSWVWMNIVPWGLVTLVCVAFATAGPRFFGGIPSQFFIVTTTLYLAFRCKDWSGSRLTLVTAAAWCLLTIPSVLANMSGIDEGIKMFRTLALIPAFAVIFGFLLIRFSPGLLTYGLLVSAGLNLAMMFTTVRTSSELSMQEFGQVIRLYRSEFTGNEIPATGATANCIAAFLLGSWFAWPTSWVKRFLFLGVFSMGLMFAVYTGTRAPLAAALLVFAVQYAVDVAVGGKVVKAFVTFLAAFGALAIGSALVPSGSLVFLDRFRLESILDLSFSGRDWIWRDRWDYILHRPMGYGIQETLGFDVMSSHNLFLELMLLAGLIPGAIVALYLSSVGIWCFVRLFIGRGSEISRCVGCAFMTALALSMFEATVSSCYQAFIFTLIMLGAFLGTVRTVNSPQASGEEIST